MVLFLVLALTSCTRENVRGERVIRNAVTDVDGNHYDAVKIGKQVWMQSNLRTKHFRDGSEIPKIEYNSSDYHYYCREPRYNNPTPHQAPTYDEATHGLYYNMATVIDSRDLCPRGWHIPSEAEWTELVLYVKSKSEYVFYQSIPIFGPPAPRIAKALASTVGWDDDVDPWNPGCNPEENNGTGFTAVPAATDDDGFMSFGSYAAFWSDMTIETSFDAPRPFYITNDYDVFLNDDSDGFYMTVRCIRDN